VPRRIVGARVAAGESDHKRCAIRAVIQSAASPANGLTSRAHQACTPNTSQPSSINQKSNGGLPS